MSRRRPHLANPSLFSPGLWLGMLICAFIPCSCSIAYIAQMDWRKASEEVPGLSHCSRHC